MDPPTFKGSTFTRISALSFRGSLFSRTIGVLPIASRIFSQINGPSSDPVGFAFFHTVPYCTALYPGIQPFRSVKYVFSFVCPGLMK
jgi:hypothetical protein